MTSFYEDSFYTKNENYIDLGLEKLSDNNSVNHDLLELKNTENWVRAFRLSTGRILTFKTPRSTLCEHHFLAYFPACQGTPDSDEKLEMINIVMKFAWEKADEIYGDKEAYSIYHNGRATVSYPDTHFHIFILSDKAAITEVYNRLYEKNRQ